MRWERLFADLESRAEHAHVEARDALVADLREGEWAERSWLDGLQEASTVELAVADVGVLSGRVRWASTEVIHLESAAASQVISTRSVRWARGATKGAALRADSVVAQLGWGHVLREMQDDHDLVRLTLAGGSIVEGRIGAVGRDFVRIVGSGWDRDVPAGAIVVATIVREA